MFSILVYCRKYIQLIAAYDPKVFLHARGDAGKASHHFVRMAQGGGGMGTRDQM